MYDVIKDLSSVFEKLNIDTFGVTDAKPYNEIMNTDYKSAIVVLFPYYCGDDMKSPLSIYTHGRDYHIVIKNLLTKAADLLGLKKYAIHADIGPAIERRLAVEAGLCFKGRNQMCINQKYGSYFFIGYIVCDEEFKFKKHDFSFCINCRKCIEACPGGALNDGFDESKCLSAITQKKGELSNYESNLIKNNDYIFGCDICQKVCPYNRSASKTEITDFCENLIFNLNLDELKDMSNKEFKRKYGNRAFAWRGKSILVRNIELKQKNE